MKRVLIISYYWPPTGGSGVQRWVKFSKYLPKFGWHPMIYTPVNPEQLARDESLLKDVPAETEIVKTKILEPYGAYRKLVGKTTATASDGEINPLNSQKKSLSKRLAIWIRGNVFVPDPRVLWVKPSVNFLSEYLKKHPADAIITTSTPQSIHLIGLYLKRRLKKEGRWNNMKWIADFRDPWTEIFYFKHLGLWPLAERKHRSLEQQVLDESDEIISVTPLVQNDFQARTSTKVHLITNGFDDDDFPDIEESDREFFTIVHTGLFASDGNPLNLWSTLSRICESDEFFRQKMRLKLIGKVDEEIVDAIKNVGLSGNLELTGYMDHADAVREQRSSAMLILPLRREPEYRKALPGKIFEYLASRRPVLGIGQEDGAAATLLRETSAGHMFDWDKGAAGHPDDEVTGSTNPLQEFILNQWEAWKKGENIKNKSDISSYSRIKLTEKLTEIL